MSPKKHGALSIFIYCLSAGLSGVWVFFDFSKNATSLYALAFITFGGATFFFWLMQCFKQRNPIKLLTQYPKDMLILNTLTLITWLSMFAALLVAEASFESAICQGWVPIVVLLCDRWLKKTHLTTLRVLGALLVALALFSLVALRVWEGASSAISAEALNKGILLGTVSGLSNGFYLYWSSRVFQKTHCSTLDILSTRFLLLLAVTALLGHADICTLFTFDRVLLSKLLLLTVFSIILPVSAYQYSIARLSEARVSLITPLVPVLSLAAELSLGHWQSVWTPTLIVVTCGLVGLSNFWLEKP